MMAKKVRVARTLASLDVSLNEMQKENRRLKDEVAGLRQQQESLNRLIQEQDEQTRERLKRQQR